MVMQTQRLQMTPTAIHTKPNDNKGNVKYDADDPNDNTNDTMTRHRGQRLLHSECETGVGTATKGRYTVLCVDIAKLQIRVRHRYDGRHQMNDAEILTRTASPASDNSEV